MARLIKENRIKEVVKEIDKENKISSIAGDVALELDKKVEELIDKAIKRAGSNNRRTLLGRDL